MPGIPNSPELFLILMVYYRIMYDTWKITRKMEFNESFSSAWKMKLNHECNISNCSTTRYSTSAKIFRSLTSSLFPQLHENKIVDYLENFPTLSLTALTRLLYNFYIFKIPPLFHVFFIFFHLLPIFKDATFPPFGRFPFFCFCCGLQFVLFPCFWVKKYLLFS